MLIQKAKLKCTVLDKGIELKSKPVAGGTDNITKYTAKERSMETTIYCTFFFFIL